MTERISSLRRCDKYDYLFSRSFLGLTDNETFNLLSTLRLEFCEDKPEDID